MGLQGWKMSLAPLVWTAYCALTDVPESVSPRPGDPPLIYACLHRDILPAIRHLRPVHPVLLVSLSPDGDILVRTLGQDAYGFVRGSTGSGGGRALAGLRRCLEEGRSVGLAVDGPKGPFGRVQEGVLHLARLTGRSIQPLRIRATGACHLRTWDRTLVPLPWGRVTVVPGNRLQVLPGATEPDLEAVRRDLERFLGDGDHVL